MKVSIIIPVYNAESTLERAVSSVRNSTHTDVEIIIVDDGSVDGSIALIDKLKKMDKRIIALNQNHCGVSCARNAGIQHATGEFILFLDSDDYFSADGLQAIVDALDDSMDMLMYHCYLHNKDYPDGKKMNVKSEIWNCRERFLESFLFPKKAMSVWSKAYRRSVILEHNISFHADLMAYEDLLFNVNYLKKCRRAVVISSLNPYHYIVVNKVYTMELFKRRDMAIFLAFERCLQCCNERERKQAELLYEELLIKTYRRFIRLKVKDEAIKKRLKTEIKKYLVRYFANPQVSFSMKIYAIVVFCFPKIALIK